jgi:hypothetical protein
MRLITLPIAMLFLVLSLGGCLASGGHHSPSFGYGYGGYGYAPYGGHAHRHYRHSYRAFEPHIITITIGRCFHIGRSGRNGKG